MEWAQDYPPAQCKGEEEHRATEQELEQLWEGHSQRSGQGLHREGEGRDKGRQGEREGGNKEKEIIYLHTSALRHMYIVLC